MNFKEVSVLQYLLHRLVEFNFKNDNKKSEIVFKLNDKLITFDSFKTKYGTPIEKSLKESTTTESYPNLSDNKSENIFVKANAAFIEKYPVLKDPFFSETIFNLINKNDYPYLLIQLTNFVKSLELDAPTSTQIAYDFKELNSDEKLDFYLIEPEATFEPVSFTISNETEE